MSQDLIEERQIRVFISSTFKDMMPERDYLVTKIFPFIRRYCEERDVSFFEVDLRWGITEEDSKQGKVVDICLKEIEKTTPFFIGLLGERYGSVPSREERRQIVENTDVFKKYPWEGAEPVEDTSITEMEIQQGVLLRTKEKINAYFYFRSPEMPTPDEFKEKSGSKPEKKLSALKKTLRDRKDHPVKDYRSIEDLGDMIEKDFKALVDKLWHQGALSFFGKERLYQKAFLKSHTKVYIPNEDALRKLDNFVNTQGEEADRAIVVTGERGIGKSALLANWIQRRQKQDKKIICHFIGNSSYEGDYRKICEYLIDELAFITDKPRDGGIADSVSGQGEDKLQETLQDMLWAAAKADVQHPNEKFILVLDGMDKLSDIDNAKLLNWLPAFPPNARVVFSNLAETQPWMFLSAGTIPVSKLRPFQ